jgi:hypothetical protein
MASSPKVSARRTIVDYLYSIDPSGQADHGYAWGTNRPESIYTVPAASGKEYIQSARLIAIRNPIWITGPGYDTQGKEVGGLVAANGHPDFKDNVAIIDYQTNDKATWPVGPLDIRYSHSRHVWEAGSPNIPFTALLTKRTEIDNPGWGESEKTGVYDWIKYEKAPGGVWSEVSGLVMGVYASGTGAVEAQFTNHALDYGSKIVWLYECAASGSFNSGNGWSYVFDESHTNKDGPYATP